MAYFYSAERMIWEISLPYISTLVRSQLRKVQFPMTEFLQFILGFVEFHYDLGSGLTVLRSKFSISLNQWHTIKISRTARLAVMKIDTQPESMTISPNGFWHLSLPFNLYLGKLRWANRFDDFIDDLYLIRRHFKIQFAAYESQRAWNVRWMHHAGSENHLLRR